MLLEKVVEIYEKLSKLQTLQSCNTVDTLLNQLVGLCTLPCSVDVDVRLLSQELQNIRSHLIVLCGEAEGLLESHYARLLGMSPRPLSLSNLRILPYYDNYRKLAELEYKMLCKGIDDIESVKRVAFVGSGPLPLTSIVFAMHHPNNATVDNYHIDEAANALSSALLRSTSLSRRMNTITRDILLVNGNELASYDVVFLAALVGLQREEKMEIVRHLANNMRSGGVVIVRSARGGRAFVYPIVDDHDIVTQSPLNIISVLHPANVINSILLARKP